MVPYTEVRWPMGDKWRNVGRAMAFRFGQTEQSMKAIGIQIKLKGMGHSGMQREMSMKGSSKMIKPTDMECIHM